MPNRVDVETSTLNPNRQLSLWDLLTFMSAAGAPGGAYAVGKLAGVNLYWRLCLAVGGLAVGALCMWFIRVSVCPLARWLFGQEQKPRFRTDFVPKVIYVLIYLVTTAWVFVSILLGERFARMFIERFRL